MIFKYPYLLKRHKCNPKINTPQITINPLEAEKVEQNIMLQKLYYRPDGYYQTAKKLLDVCRKEGYNFHIDDVKEWLNKQAIWQIHSPVPHIIPRASFNGITRPNDYHQADTLYLPHDKVNGKVYKYCLCIVDVASRFKGVVPITDRSSVTVAKAFRQMYNDKKCPLTWPDVLMVDDGSEFKQKVKKMMLEKGVRIKIGNTHRSQSIVERFNRTLAERLFRVQDAKEMITGNVDTAWVKNLPIVVEKINNEITRLIGIRPADAIKEKEVFASSSKLPKNRKIGMEEIRLPANASVQYLLDYSDIIGNKRATDINWSQNIYTIKSSLVNSNQPVLYELDGENAPKRMFVREELLEVPYDTELPPQNILI